jgi:single-strand DNA-binding protein
MNLNLVVLCGRLAAPPEIRVFESGSTLVRSLITVRSDAPRRRVDVVPVTLWDPAPDHEILTAVVGEEVWTTGAVQRRFWSSAEGRRSRLEVVAHHIQLTRIVDVQAPAGSGPERDSVTATVE